MSTLFFFHPLIIMRFNITAVRKEYKNSPLKIKEEFYVFNIIFFDISPNIQKPKASRLFSIFLRKTFIKENF